MLRAAVAAAILATAYCGAKGPPQPPARETPDAGAPKSPSPSPSTSPSTSTSTSTSAPDSGIESPATRTVADAGSP